MQLKKELILQEDQGEAVLFDPDSLLTAWLNHSAVLIWKDLCAGYDEEQIVAHFSSLYDMDETSIRRDVTAVLDDFRNAGFLLETQE